jgi:hypothetical protein
MTLKLMEIAEDLGLPVETINQAGGYFLSKIPGYRKSLVLLHTGPQARIYRPDALLYVLLKLPRLSESDLGDCLRFLDYTRAQGEPLARDRLLARVRGELAKGPSPDRKSRLKVLKEAVEGE